MAEVIDTLVTELTFRTDAKDIERAKKLLEQLKKEQDKVADSLADYEARQREAAKAALVLAAEQTQLREELAKVTEQTARLTIRKRQLVAEMRKQKQPTAEQAKALADLESELAAVSRETRHYRQELTRVGIDQAKLRGIQAGTATQIGELTRKQTRLTQSSATVREGIGKLNEKLVEHRDSIRSTLSSFGEAGSTLARFGALTGGAVLGGVALLGREVITTGANFESLRASLKTVEGSTEGATRAFGLIQTFAKDTPFQLDEVTTSFVRLKNLGLDASKESLTAFGNIAAAQGKTMIDFIEAVADASTGEFERLKEFGIKASKQGEQVTFTFKGQQTVVKNTADDISAFLKGIGETDFAGAMADQMATTKGVMSNLEDAVSSFFDEVAQTGVLDEFKLLLGDLLGVVGGDDGLAQAVAGVLVEALRGLREMLANVESSDIESFLRATLDAVEALVNIIVGGVSAFMAFSDTVGGTQQAIELLALGVLALSTAFSGPVGLAFAAGAAGAAIGGMVANLAASNVETAITIAQIEQLSASIAQMELDAKNREAAAAGRTQAYENDRKEREKREAADVEQAIGGLGAGLVKDDPDKAFRIRQVRKGSDAEREQGLEALFTAEGRAVQQAVVSEESRRADKVEQTARTEAKKRGSDEESAARQARAASFEESKKTRKKAFEQATEVFSKTGSTEQAIEAATKVGAIKEPKKKGKKGAKGAKEKDDSLAHTIEKQLDENAKKIAQMRAARALREKRIGVDELKSFEDAEYTKVREASGARYRETGELPAGIAQDLRQISRVPNESDLAGRTAPPVISIQNNKYEITGNEFMVTVEGQFATTGQEVGRMALHELRRGLNLLLGEATPTPEKR